MELSEKYKIELINLQKAVSSFEAGLHASFENLDSIGNDLIKNGVYCIIMVSSELPEILGMSDRIFVMHNGKFSGELLHKNASQEVIMQYATGHLIGESKKYEFN